MDILEKGLSWCLSLCLRRVSDAWYENPTAVLLIRSAENTIPDDGFAVYYFVKCLQYIRPRMSEVKVT